MVFLDPDAGYFGRAPDPRPFYFETVGYCRVRRREFSRGTDSDGYRKLASAWCAENPQDTLTRLKQKEKVEENVCTPNPIAEQFRLGQEVGVRGTPAIVTEGGQMIPGYQSADELMVTLGLN